jgi:two-component system response regulator NreC
MEIRIFIVDDHALIRAGLRSILEQQKDLVVIGEAEDGAMALQKSFELQPDLVLMDISLPDMNGIETTRRMREILPDLTVLILTVHEDESLLRAAMRAGASGYILKRAADAEILRAIQVVTQGDVYVHPSMTRLLLKEAAPRPAKSEKHVVEELTSREIEILRYLARGYTNRQIADTLKLSPRTVEGHRANLSGKLGLHSRVELVTFAEENGLLD